LTVDERVARMLEIATQILEEGRSPTEEEQVRFRALQAEIEAQPGDWKARFGDIVDRFAAALESMGL
jgi:hypothetical protein